MLKKIAPLTVAGSLALITACSGGGSSSGSGTGATGYGQGITAQFIDAPVKGLKFANEAGIVNYTGDEGKFSCKRGELVKFFLGDFELGYSACGSKIFVQDLASSKPNFTWGQAAAIIQSFAIDESDYLDLSVLNHDAVDLDGLAYQATPANIQTLITTALGASAAAYSEDVTPPTSSKTVAQAISEADSFLETELPEQLDFVLGQLESDATTIILEATLENANYPDLCWDNIRAKAQIVATKESFIFKVNSAISYDSEEFVNMTNLTCMVGADPDEQCDSATANQLPQPKIITDSTIGMIFSHERTESMNGQSIEVVVNNALYLNAEIKSGSVEFNGIFDNKMTGKASAGQFAGKSAKCVYKVTSSTPVDTELPEI